MDAAIQDAGPSQKTGPCSYCHGIGVLEATDMFCGAGGSSLGLEHVCCPLCGRQLIRVTQAINHWDLAVEAHNANFPDADHDVHSVVEVPASRFRRTSLFWASPECVNHTSCKGKRDESPEAQRSRATFKDIVRFTACHKYDAVFVENVVEARLWCEHEECACGTEFDAWFHTHIKPLYKREIPANRVRMGLYGAPPSKQVGPRAALTAGGRGTGGWLPCTANRSRTAVRSTAMQSIL